MFNFVICDEIVGGRILQCLLHACNLLFVHVCMYVCMYVRRAHWFLNFIGIGGGGGLVYLGAVYVYLYNRDRGSHDHRGVSVFPP